MEEIWKNLQEPFEDYQVSTLGRVRSFKAGKLGHILSVQVVKGYSSVALFDSITKKNKHMRIHRLVAEAFIENPSNYSDVNHKDRDKSNNRIDNLEWTSHKDNTNYGRIELDTLQSLHKLSMKLNKSVDDTTRTIIAYYTLNKDIHI